MSELIEKLKKESERIEEDVLYSGKKHFNASNRWSGYHYWLGIPNTVICAIAGGTAFADEPQLAGVIALAAAALSAVITFLKTDERASKHKATGSAYFSIKNQARIFREIECMNNPDEEYLRRRLLELSERRDALNEQALNTSDDDYKKAKEGVEAGEQNYAVDKR